MASRTICTLHRLTDAVPMPLFQSRRFHRTHMGYWGFNWAASYSSIIIYIGLFVNTSWANYRKKHNLFLPHYRGGRSCAAGLIVVSPYSQTTYVNCFQLIAFLIGYSSISCSTSLLTNISSSQSSSLVGLSIISFSFRVRVLSVTPVECCPVMSLLYIIG